MTQTQIDSKSFLTERANAIQDSITMAISAKAKAMKAAGQNVLSFSAGEPDFDTPDAIKAAGIQSINEGKTKYTAAAGIPELRAAVASKLQADNNVSYESSQIVVSCGAKHSIFNALMAVVQSGDEVIIPSPYWVSYPDQVKLMGATPVIVTTTDQSAFKMTPQQLEQAITPQTKLVILNSPSNPTGGIYSKDELQALADVIVKHQVLVLSDEIYEHLVYGGAKHYSIASFGSEIKALSIVINGVSKAYSMTGWRIGYMAAAAPIAKACAKLQSQVTSNPTVASQYAALEALTGSQAAVSEMRSAFSVRREVMTDGLNAIEGISCLLPGGAFYTFPNVSALYGKRSSVGVIQNSVDFCAHLLEEQEMACVPGSGFGADDYIRLSYACSSEDIQAGLARLSAFVGSLAS
jgi:aspartate aminotransferase